MKLPWDKDYLKISFHVIFTLAAVLGLWVVLKNISPIVKTILDTFGYIFSALSPLWIGLITAYLLEPLAEYFQKKYEIIVENNHTKINSLKKKLGLKNTKKEQSRYKTRTAGATISYIMIVVIIIILGFFVSSSIGSSGSESNIDNIINQFTQTLNSFTTFLNKAQVKLQDLGVFEHLDLRKPLDEIINMITSFTQNLGNQAVALISKTGGYVVNFTIGLVIAFYFIKDKCMFIDKLKEFSSVLIPKKINLKIRTALSDIDAIFSGYIRGQLTDAAIMAVLITLVLSIIGIDFAVLVGIVSGFSNVIPYVGAFVGVGLAIIIGLLSGTPWKALASLIALVILQQIDGAFIVPKVVGNKVDLHPILVLLALAVGGTVFGITGMILAVPVTAILKIFLLRYMQRRKKENDKATFS